LRQRVTSAEDIYTRKQGGTVMELAGKVAIVTGASRGIGEAIALGFAREGSAVVMCSRHLPDVERVAEEARASGAGALAVKCDVSEEEDVNEMVRKTIEEFGKVDILVNNAACMDFEFKYFQQTEVSEWNEQINTTFKGVLYCCKAVIPHMIDQDGGRIINITSEGAKLRNSKASLYCASKAAVAMFSQCIADGLARYGILVNCVAPGSIETEAFARNTPPITREKMVSSLPLRRLGKPAEIADMVLFLASEKAKYITGQHFSVSGGMTML
jgi:NAD(P)-dependent dehydrogenase (short-subunit alcohol dehydrogenase family)